jgi:two-component system sensor histidine kinase/response regulator
MTSKTAGNVNMEPRTNLNDGSRSGEPGDGARAEVTSGLLALAGKEIAAPIRVMLDTLQLLLSTELSEEQRNYAEGVRRCGAALMTAVNDILDLSNIESGEIRLEAIDFDLHTAVVEATKALEKAAPLNGLEITCLIHQDVPKLVRGDPGRLRQVISHFLSDAIRSIPQRGTKAVLSLKLVAGSPNDFEVKFEVCASEAALQGGEGSGWDGSMADFASSTLPKPAELGLENSRRFATLMGGRFGADGEPGKRTSVWFSVRLGKPRESHAELPAPRPDLRGLSVLAVGDNEAAQNNLVAQVLSWGMTCDVAPNATQALQMLRTAASRGRSYSLALLDMQRAGSDALDLARAIQVDSALSGVRPVILTAVGMRGETEEFRRAGIAGYLTKPVNQSDLYNCLATVVSAPAGTDDTGTLVPQPVVTSHNLKEAKARRRAHALVVEDNTVNQMVAVRMLEKFGVRADIAITGVGAIEACKRNPYDLILMDCAMPEMGGYAATRAIRDLERERGTGHTPVVAITANAMQGDREKCLDAGMDDYISKPFGLEQFRELLARWISSMPSPGAAIEASRVAQEPAAIDASFLEDLRANPADGLTEFLTQLRGQFLREAGDRLAAINEAVLRGDSLNLKRAAHGLKGSSGVVGAKTMAALCAELERRAADEQMNDVAPLAEELQCEFGRVRDELDAKLAG